MDKEVIELSRKMCRRGSELTKLGEEIFFNSNPTWEEYLEFRKDRNDIKLFTKEQFERFILEQNELMLWKKNS